MLNRYIGVVLLMGFPAIANATSFTVDNATTGSFNSALQLEPPPAPNDVFHTYLRGTNTKDVDNAVLDEPPDATPLPQVGQRLNSLSAGFEPLDGDIWDIIFSVSRDSVGVEGSSVNLRRFSTVGADLFFTNPTFRETNRWLVDARSLGVGGADPEVDGMEVFDSREGFEILYDGFTPNEDDVFMSLTGRNDILLDPFGMRDASVFRSGGSMGLLDGDEVDALALDFFLDDDEPEALFSLSPDSPTLSLFDLSAADIFYTDFDGSFEIAGPENINFAFDLTHENLGLLFDDNVDALDIVATSTPFGIPLDPNWPADAAVIPTPLPMPGWMLLVAISLLGIRSRPMAGRA